MSDPYLNYKSIKDNPVCGHLDFNCHKLKYEVLKLVVWMRTLICTMIQLKTTLDFYCLKLKYELSNSYTMGCPPVRGDNPQALASGLSYVQADNPWYNYFIPPTSM